MTGWHLGPMAPFDLETTGVSVETDRVVTACAGIIQPAPEPPWEVKVWSWLVDPGIEIPAEATVVHGVTTEQAKAGRPPKEALDEIAHDLAFVLRGGIPLVGSNLAYDLTLLDRELRRYDLDTLEDRIAGPIAPVIDVFVLDKAVDPYRKGSRKLVDLCAHYGVRIDGAHDSTFDALAAARVAYRIGQRSQMSSGSLTGLYSDRRYPEDVARAFQSIGRMSLADLHAAQIGWRREQCDSLRAYFDSRGKEHDGVPGDWPLIPYRTGASV